jgi:hypothetical protein
LPGAESNPLSGLLYKKALQITSEGLFCTAFCMGFVGC